MYQKGIFYNRNVSSFKRNVFKTFLCDFLKFTVLTLKCDCDLNKFKESIVPAIVSEVPPKEIEVIYNGQAITCGQDVDINITKNAPTIKYDAVNIDFHTLIMIDPDAPDPHRPVYSQFVHWLVIDIPGNQVSKGKTHKKYMAPSPPPYSAPHRYVFLVFRQEEYFYESDYMKSKGRSHFSVAKMLKELDFIGLVAGNFFYTRSNVRLLY